MRVDLDWRDRLEVGDVIRRGRGPFRIVRTVNKRRDGRIHSLQLVIRRCSWTGRCTTTLIRSDLRTIGYHRVDVARRPLDAPIDRKILAAIRDPADRRPYRLTCCDVEGLA